MPEIRSDIKETLRQAGRTLADLCRETGIEYKRLSGIVNGYWHASLSDDRAIADALARFQAGGE